MHSTLSSSRLSIATTFRISARSIFNHYHAIRTLCNQPTNPCIWILATASHHLQPATNPIIAAEPQLCTKGNIPDKLDKSLYDSRCLVGLTQDTTYGQELRLVRSVKPRISRGREEEFVTSILGLSKTAVEPVVALVLVG